jgi:hypothetical protein
MNRPRVVAFTAGVSALGLAAVFARWPGLAETLYGSWLGPWIAYLLSRLTGVVPFSLAEWLLGAFLVRQTVRAVVGIVRARRGARSWRTTLLRGALGLGQDLAIVIAAFYVLWGFHYGRPSLESRWGWNAQEVDAGLLSRLSLEVVAETNAAYLALVGQDDLGQPTPPRPRTEIDAAIEAGYRVIAGGWSPCATRTYGRTKRPWISPLMDRLGISGFYFPFTGEANVNQGLPGVLLPQTTAHEKAHQRGFAPEDEANFVGFLAGYASGDPLARYAALLFAQRQLLRTLAHANPERTGQLVAMRVPGVQRDVDAIVSYWDQYRGRARAVSHAVNDAYLKSNRVEGGVRSYSGSVDLILRWAQQERTTKP